MSPTETIKKPIHRTHAPGQARLMPKKVLLLGSGGLKIGKGGEFDY